MSMQSHRESIVVHKREDIELVAQKMDDDHIDVDGGLKNDWAAAYASADGLLEVGFQEFRGSMELGATDGRENVTVILSGSGEVVLDDGSKTSFSAGDIVVFDWPGPGRTITSAGFTAVYVTRFRSEEVRAASRPQGGRRA